MIWTIGAFAAWIKDDNRPQLEFRASDMLLIGGCVLISFIVWNFLI